jgi:hypothetical protein
MSNRLRLIQEAERPKMYGRAMVSGPSGSGKTWTSLSIAAYLAAFEKLGPPEPGQPIDLSVVDKSDILVVDTEKESALTYADVFKFSHLPWRPPFDPDELCATLAGIEAGSFLVVMIDSLSKFWGGAGGILDVAGGSIGGWKTARPMQERLVEAVLNTSAHVLLGVRSKMDYLIEGGKGNQTVTKVGLAPVQDDNLVYEMNVAVDIDMEHRITVTKSRTSAVPVGRMYPAGMERKLAEDYAEWLAGGIPPANRADIDAIIEAFSGIVDKEQVIRVKHEFKQEFGMPHSLTAAQIPLAREWLDARLAELDAPATQPEPEAETPEDPAAGPEPEPTPDPADPDPPAEATPPRARAGSKAKPPTPAPSDDAADEEWRNQATADPGYDADAQASLLSQ